MLDLFAAGLEGKIVSISSACIASAVPPTTALRWLNKLEEMGMVQRTDDAEDARRAYVQITPTAQDAIQHWLALSPLLAAASSRATD
ncbi:MAG: winged helix DNA-binding protein [Sphingomonas sp.]